MKLDNSKDLISDEVLSLLKEMNVEVDETKRPTIHSVARWITETYRFAILPEFVNNYSPKNPNSAKYTWSVRDLTHPSGISRLSKYQIFARMGFDNPEDATNDAIYNVLDCIHTHGLEESTAIEIGYGSFELCQVYFRVDVYIENRHFVNDNDFDLSDFTEIFLKSTIMDTQFNLDRRYLDSVEIECDDAIECTSLEDFIPSIKNLSGMLCIGTEILTYTKHGQEYKCMVRISRNKFQDEK